MYLSAWLLLSLALLLLYVAQQQLSYFRRRGIPHLKPSLIYGNLRHWQRTQHTCEVLKQLYDKFKRQAPFAGLYFYYKRVYVITDLELIKRIMIKDFANFDSRGMFFNARDDPLSAHLLALNGAKAHQLRAKMTPAFSSGKLKYMFPTLLNVGMELMGVLAEIVPQTGTHTLDISGYMARYTADAIGTCAFGIECNSLRDPQAIFVRVGLRAAHRRRLLSIICTLLPKLALKLRLKKTPRDIEQFYMGIVRETIAHRERYGIKRNDYMDILLELKHKHDKGLTAEGLTFEEIAAQMYIFFIAGFETSASTLSFALYELSRNQCVQQKLRKDIETVLAQHKNHFSYEALQEMRYLEQCIAETLRMYPIGSEHIRLCNAHYTTDDPKFYIEKGARVLIPAYAIQRDPDLYPAPEKFMPERFTNEQIQKRHMCAYMPFGLGPRACLGMRFSRIQIGVPLVLMLQKYRFTLTSEHQPSPEFAKNAFLLHAKNGIQLKVERL